jgi:FKBP-type peptidyl-prolyl cis-trans isomerase FklB
MRKMLCMSIAGVALLAGAALADDARSLTTAKEKKSYAVGVDLVRNFKRQGIEADLNAVIRGMQEESAGKKLLMTEAELTKTLTDYNLELKGKQVQLRQQAAEKNKKEGEAFLAANKVKDGVVTLPSGLQYKVLKAGNGKAPGEDDGVTCRYRGTLLDGTEFDSSEGMGMPVTFYVRDSTIEGWKEALKLMPAGSKWQIFVPSKLGFGEKGAGRDVGPNATLIYEIELLAVNPQRVIPKKKD